VTCPFDSIAIAISLGVSTMERQELETLYARIQKVEQRLRLLLEGWVLSVLVLGSLVLGVMWSTPTAFRVQSVEIVDKDGRMRIVLGVGHDAPVLLLQDAQARARVRLGLLPDGTPQLELYGPGQEILFRAP